MCIHTTNAHTPTPVVCVMTLCGQRHRSASPQSSSGVPRSMNVLLHVYAHRCVLWVGIDTVLSMRHGRAVMDALRSHRINVNKQIDSCGVQRRYLYRSLAYHSASCSLVFVPSPGYNYTYIYMCAHMVMHQYSNVNGSCAICNHCTQPACRRRSGLEAPSDVFFVHDPLAEVRALPAELGEQVPDGF